jgi:diaminopimelate epimerase
MIIPFSKYQGTGNDFILIDNRQLDYILNEEFVAKLCDRRFGIGADGLMELRNEAGYDFRMVYYNSDGKEGSMCGNGGRCITRFANDIGIKKNEYEFVASDGPHQSWIDEDQFIHLKMKDVTQVDHYSRYDFLDTGSPHVVKTVQDLRHFPVVEEGREIRYNDYYKEKGVNVNFVEVTDDDSIFVRTYERGVEDETYSCGTGVTAAALANAHNDTGFNHVEVKTLGGKLYVEFDKTGETSFENIWLCGPAKKVFEGTVSIKQFQKA